MGLLFILLVIGTTIWATVEAVNIQRYKYQGYCGGFFVFLGCALLWIVFFPLYLIRRGAIINGTAEVRPEYENDPPPLVLSRQNPAAPSSMASQKVAVADNRYEQLQKLGELKAKGVLTEEEFAREKAKLLES